MGLTWTENLDDNDNTYYEAESSLREELDSPCNWVVAPAYERDRVVWLLEESSPELFDDAPAQGFPEADDAKAWCETREAERLAKA